MRFSALFKSFFRSVPVELFLFLCIASSFFSFFYCFFLFLLWPPFRRCRASTSFSPRSFIRSASIVMSRIRTNDRIAHQSLSNRPFCQPMFQFIASHAQRYVRWHT